MSDSYLLDLLDLPHEDCASEGCRADTCCRAVRSGMQDLSDNYVEYTLSLPKKKPYIDWSTSRMEEHYKMILQDVKTHLLFHFSSCEVVSQLEISSTGWAHSHGYIKVSNSKPFYVMGLLQDIARVSYKHLSRANWRHLANAELNYILHKLRTPFVCLNYKNKLDQNWLDYMNKNAPRSDSKK